MVETVEEHAGPAQKPGGNETAPENNTLSGRIEAIKLTGDVNIPRGECTWFAEDIGEGGFVRNAEDGTFKGARIVKSMGHVADRGFINSRFISSQLIMISRDLLAQYWEVRGNGFSSQY